MILWVNTFNNYFHAKTAQHAFEVLEAAGYDVVVPLQNLCCGRPLYDYGMLDRAKQFLRDVIDELRPELERGTPIVGLEPSCISVFKDELLNLFPDDADARRLSESVTLFGDFLAADASWSAPRLAAKATVHAHCHHKSVLGTAGDKSVLEAMGVDANWLDDGCCGMAGAFGFEAGEHYEVSVAVGELALLPSIRSAGPDDLIITDGFSCREQICQCTDREALHLADVIHLALRQLHPPAPLLRCHPELVEGRACRRTSLSKDASLSKDVPLAVSSSVHHVYVKDVAAVGQDAEAQLNLLEVPGLGGPIPLPSAGGRVAVAAREVKAEFRVLLVAGTH